MIRSLISGITNLFGDTGRALIYLVAGVLLFVCVLGGFRETWILARQPRTPHAAAAKPMEKPERYVPPAEVVYPFF